MKKNEKNCKKIIKNNLTLVGTSRIISLALRNKRF